MRTFMLLFVAGGLAGSTSFAAEKIDFAKEIEPIFQKTCVKCHGAEKQKGKLRLDNKADALKGGKDGPALVPGQADKSEMVRRISLPAGNDDIMPNEGDPLSKAQIDLIRDWINQGAIWPDTVAKAPAAAAPEPALKPMNFKLNANQQKAVAKLESLGAGIRPIAMNVGWMEANFHSVGTNLTDAALEPVKDVPSLVELNLGGTKISDAGAAHVKALTNLTHLHLEQTKITDAAMANLKNLTNLEYLNLYGTAVTDAGLESLKGLKNLRHLYVWQTKVTEPGAKALQAAIPKLDISRGWELTAVTNKEAAKPEKEKEKEKK